MRLLRTTAAVAALSGACAVLPAQAAVRAYYRLPLNNKATYKPSKIAFNDLDLTSIHWTNWGSSVARGTAKTDSGGTAHLKVFDLKTIKGKKIYGCMTGTTSFKAPSHQIQWPPGCAARN